MLSEELSKMSVRRAGRVLHMNFLPVGQIRRYRTPQACRDAYRHFETMLRLAIVEAKEIEAAAQAKAKAEESAREERAAAELARREEARIARLWSDLLVPRRVGRVEIKAGWNGGGGLRTQRADPRSPDHIGIFEFGREVDTVSIMLGADPPDLSAIAARWQEAMRSAESGPVEEQRWAALHRWPIGSPFGLPVVMAPLTRGFWDGEVWPALDGETPIGFAKGDPLRPTLLWSGEPPPEAAYMVRMDEAWDGRGPVPRISEVWVGGWRRPHGLCSVDDTSSKATHFYSQQ